MTIQRRKFRFSLWHVFLVITLLSLALGRWHSTSTRRDAYKHLTRLPCGFVSQRGGGDFVNPSDVLGIEFHNTLTDFFSPPRIYAIHMHSELNVTECRQFQNLIEPFSELSVVVLHDNATDADSNFWRKRLADHVRIVVP